MFSVPASVLNDWISNPSTNAGFLLRDGNEAGLAGQIILFVSAEGALGQTPVLAFETALPPAPIPEPGMAGALVALATLARRRCHCVRRV